MNANVDAIESISFPIAIVVSLFNRDITAKLQHGTIQRLAECGFVSNDIMLMEVPGAIEIPITINQIACTRWPHVIIALGAIIRGETSHYDVVCQQVSYGCQHVALTHNIPVIFGILTTENEIQATARVDGMHGHKGREVVDCAIHMYKVQHKIAAWNST